MNAKKFLLALSAVPLLFAGCSGPTFTQPTRPQINDSGSSNSSYNQPISVADKKILVELVDTDSSRQRGLSGREKLEDGQGMLFDFTNAIHKQPAFWMKDMNFAIDIIWINSGRVIGVTPKVPPPNSQQTLPTYSPPGDITHVLEVPSGWSERNNIAIGDEVKF